MSEKPKKSAKVIAGRLQTGIRGIRSLPQNKRVLMESKNTRTRKRSSGLE